MIKKVIKIPTFHAAILKPDFDLQMKVKINDLMIFKTPSITHLTLS